MVSQVEDGRVLRRPDSAASKCGCWREYRRYSVDGGGDVSFVTQADERSMMPKAIPPRVRKLAEFASTIEYLYNGLISTYCAAETGNDENVKAGREIINLAASHPILAKPIYRGGDSLGTHFKEFASCFHKGTYDRNDDFEPCYKASLARASALVGAIVPWWADAPTEGHQDLPEAIFPKHYDGEIRPATAVAIVKRLPHLVLEADVVIERIIVAIGDIRRKVDRTSQGNDDIRSRILPHFAD